MTEIWIQKAFKPVRRHLPDWASSQIRKVATALLAPALFSYRSGHFRSSLSSSAVQKDGMPLPWYTYPAIDFLKQRDYGNRTVLEFGAGNSTLWWALRAKQVTSFEGDAAWFEKLKEIKPENVDLHLVSNETAECLSQVAGVLGVASRFDVIVIDGLCRYELADVALRHVSDDGIIVCDNADHFGLYDAFRDSGLQRVDFYGNAPGVVLPHATSIFFRSGAFALDAQQPIAIIALED